MSVRLEDDRPLLKWKRKVRSRKWYSPADRTLASKVVEALHLDLSKVHAEYEADDDERRSYFNALHRCYPCAPIRLEFTGLYLNESDLPFSNLLDGFKHTRAYREFRELQERTWAVQRLRDESPKPVVGSIFKHRGVPYGLVVHNLPLPTESSGAYHFIKHQNPDLTGDVFIQTFEKFLQTLAGAALPPPDVPTALDELARAILKLLGNGHHIEGASSSCGGEALGRLDRGNLELYRAALPSGLTGRQFLKRLHDAQMITRPPTRETFWFRRKINGIANVPVLKLSPQAFSSLRAMIDLAGGPTL